MEIPKKLLTLGNSQIDYLLSRKIKKQLQLIQPDVIHIQDTYILPAAVAANKTLKIPSVATIRNSVLDETWHLMFPRPISTMLCWRNKTIIKALHSIDCVVSVSDYIKSELVQRGVDGKKIQTIYNLPPNFPEVETPKTKRTASTIQLFAPGLLASFKGFTVLIDAMKQVVQKNPNVHLTIAGDGPQKKSLQKQTRNLKLESHITLTGKIPFDSLSQYYSISDIVIFPSIYAEPFGRVALEAMYFGKPVVASRVGGIPEVVENGVTGLMVAENRPQELARAISILLRDSVKRLQMGLSGKAVVGSKFDASTIIQRHFDVYNRLTSTNLLHNGSVVGAL